MDATTTEERDAECESWGELELRVRRDLGRHDFRLWELRVLDVVLRRSLARGRPAAVIPDRALLCRLAGFYKAGGGRKRTDHLVSVLEDLERGRVLVPGLWRDGVYQVQVDAGRWKREELTDAREAELAEAAIERASAHGIGAAVAQAEAGPEVADRRNDFAPDTGAQFEGAVAEATGLEGLRQLRRALAGHGKNLDGSGPGELPGRSAGAPVDCREPEPSESMNRPGRSDQARPGCGSMLPPGIRDGERENPEIREDCPESGTIPKTGMGGKGGNVVQRYNVLESKNVTTLERYNVASRIPGAEQEMITRLRRLVGEEDWGFYGGAWIVHGIRKRPQVIESVIADIESMVRERGWFDRQGKPITNKGAYCWSIFKLFGGRS